MSSTEVTVVIPAYEPSPVLVDVVFDLLGAGVRGVVVVDDGSPDEYADTFARLEDVDGVELLRHEANRGKGAALRTAFEHVLDGDPAVPGVVTADADGQHTVTDILRVADALAQRAHTGRTLVLGERDFDLPAIPWKSRLGNKLTTQVVRGLSGHQLPDTQTGLRGLSRDLLDDALAVPGDRFDYEMRALMHLLDSGTTLVHVPIATVYEGGENDTTHFRPVRDSVVIYATLLRQLLTFAVTSLTGFAVDIGIFALLVAAAFAGDPGLVGIGVATIVARICSALVNYGANRFLVFGTQSTVQRSMTRYAVLAVGLVLASWLLTAALTPVLGRHVVWAKIAVDSGLFVASYLVQRRWVFTAPEPLATERHTPAPLPRHTAPGARRNPATRHPSSAARRERAGAAPTG